MRQGQRTDLEKVVNLVRSGTTNLSTIADECPREYIMYNRGIREYIRAVRPIEPRDFKTETTIFWGEPGTGKSRKAYEEAKGFGTVYYKPRGEWWDGYQQQTSVIIDDFYGWIKYDELLKLTDRYPYQVPIKGGYEVFNSKFIFITSNKPYPEWYRFDGYNTASAALSRRIDRCIRFGVNNEIVIEKDVRFENLINELDLYLVLFFT